MANPGLVFIYFRDFFKQKNYIKKLKATAGFEY